MGWGSLAGAVVGAGASIYDTSQNNSAQANINAETMAFNNREMMQGEAFAVHQQANAQRYDTMMANSAEQRRVADLKAAGLNPMLAGINQSGAAAPSSPAVNSGTASVSGLGRSTSNLAGALSSGMNSASAIKSMKNLDQDTENKLDQGDLTRKQASLTAEQQQKANADQVVAQRTVDQEVDARRRTLVAQSSSAESQAQSDANAAKLSGYALAGAKNQSDVESDIGTKGAWLKYLDTFAHTFGGASSAVSAFRNTLR